MGAYIRIVSCTLTTMGLSDIVWHVASFGVCFVNLAIVCFAFQEWRVQDNNVQLILVVLTRLVALGVPYVAHTLPNEGANALQDQFRPRLAFFCIVGGIQPAMIAVDVFLLRSVAPLLLWCPAIIVDGLVAVAAFLSALSILEQTEEARLRAEQTTLCHKTAP